MRDNFLLLVLSLSAAAWTSVACGHLSAGVAVASVLSFFYELSKPERKP